MDNKRADFTQWARRVSGGRRTVILGAWTVSSLLLAGGCANVQVVPIDVSLARGVSDANALLTTVLATHLHDERVDYRGLQGDTLLDSFIAWVSVTDPDTIASEAARLAFWINAYNAYTLKVIRDNYPIKSINDLHSGGLYLGVATRRTVWDKDLVRVNGEAVSLNHVEHKIIRAVFKDARVHFALVCGARSCPALRAEAYVGPRLDEQLDDQAIRFLAHEDKNRFDIDSRTAHLSKVFDWFKGDFGNNDAEVLSFVARFAPPDVRASIQQNPGDWRIKHTHYDWALNE